MNNETRSSNVFGEAFSSLVIRNSFVLRALSFSSFVEEREHQFGFGNDRVIHHTMAFRFRQSFATRFCELGVDKNRVTGQDWFPKFYAVRAHKIADAAGGFCQSKQQDAGYLRHGFDLHHARHHRMTWKMSLKERLVDRDCFDPDAFGLRFETENPIDHQKRESVRQNLHYLINVESAVAAWNGPRRGKGTSARLFAYN